MKSLDDIIEFYRDPMLAKFGGGEMVRLLDLVGDVLRSKVLFFSTSHSKLWISKIATYPECTEQPNVGIYSDGLMIDFDYHESWRDGPFYRTRSEVIRCDLEHAKTALPWNSLLVSNPKPLNMLNIRSAFPLSLLLISSLATAASADEPAKAITYKLDAAVPYLPAEATANDPYAREKCVLDFYRPEGVKGFPTVVYYHGGGLTGGSRSIPKELKNRGWGVVGVSYRLSPMVKHPTYIEDAAAALAWTFKNVAAHGGDPAKIFVTGISAGGYLTAIIGLDKSYLAAHDVDANRIAALIPVTGQMITHYTIREEQGIKPSKTRPTLDKYGPVHHVRADAPPTLCVTGGWEVDMNMRAEENLYFVSMMKLAGHKNVRQIVIEGADHGRCGRECWPHVTAFIEQTLAGSGNSKATEAAK